ncbi:hypothetical protein [Actinokineospora globicatena]|uniref:Uncharacterized protein n=1 Tax=Actinokineospora globicatena TaxID=103729 RepID=A0A9W6QUG5_9PSEU|nr:hypothetical protein [Actinokineospora globicatena]MCP2306398.1 hypothetical protein [Actinokineospora globicatena]GLW81824.1 hypothetical protein Aglo01_63050 [Actinokineospora globicatena]GLW88618.1 hypothetical protein Aglo02_62570 [Actinokineospora globicatena]GLW95248.1 hypothetical protein Aglo03_60640 [Actinokineospora globicatena]
MTTEPLIPDPLYTGLSSLASQEATRFTDRNLRVRRSPVVHAVRMTPWVAGLTMPAPACGQGWSGPGAGELHPAAEPVTCGHCLSSAEARAAAVTGSAVTQPPLPFPA